MGDAWKGGNTWRQKKHDTSKHMERRHLQQRQRPGMGENDGWTDWKRRIEGERERGTERLEEIYKTVGTIGTDKMDRKEKVDVRYNRDIASHSRHPAHYINVDNP